MNGPGQGEGAPKGIGGLLNKGREMFQGAKKAAQQHATNAWETGKSTVASAATEAKAKAQEAATAAKAATRETAKKAGRGVVDAAQERYLGPEGIRHGVEDVRTAVLTAAALRGIGRAAHEVHKGAKGRQQQRDERERTTAREAETVNPEEGAGHGPRPVVTRIVEQGK